MARGLYIHVPFCLSRCDFCAFYLQIYRPDRATAYLDSLEREIRLHAARESLGGPLDSVYFGGGTPTTLNPDQLRGVVDAVRSSFGFNRNSEVTIEAHPDTVTRRDLDALLESGFNRISFGLQSTHQTELVQVGRQVVLDGLGAISQARPAGFSNINVDLMFGLPSQILGSWRETLQRVLSLQPAHVSCYALTVEEKTALHLALERAARIQDGWMGPQVDVQDAMQDEAVRLLGANGFVRYEISNFALPGYECRHNLLYWTDGDYLGLGPSAQSYLHGVRFGNVEDLTAYNCHLTAGRLPIDESEALSLIQRRREAIVFGLRRTEGVDLNCVQEAMLAADADHEWNTALDRVFRAGWLEQSADRIRLTESGRRFADAVATELI
jgi:oxygen-independent coproporphyrinogen III oxidase